jgi:ribulose-phosphate 3-epimerase
MDKNGAHPLVEVDGGISTGNTAALVDAGADILVAGSFIFGSDDPAATIREIKAIAGT